VRTREAHDRARRRQRSRLKALRERVALASALGFAALLGLAGQHVASAKHRTVVLQAGTAASHSPVRFFDEADASYAFDAGAARDARTPQAQQAQPPAEPSTPPPPPVAVTSVS
jgi:hypothetical protein